MALDKHHKQKQRNRNFKENSNSQTLNGNKTINNQSNLQNNTNTNFNNSSNFTNNEIIIRIIEYLAAKISNGKDYFTFDFQNYDVYFL